MKALFKMQRAGKTARPILRYTLTLKAKQLSKMDRGARVGDVLVSDDMKHLQQDLQQADPKAITAAAKQIESHTRIWACNKHRHRDHFTVSAPAGMSHKFFKKLAVKAMPELAVALKLCSYVAVFHKDCKHPHLHIVADAYAPSLGKGIRRHISKDKLNKLIEMTWTKHFDAPSPGVGADRSERGQKILKETFKGTSKAKVDLAAKVYKTLGGKVTSVESMVKILDTSRVSGVSNSFYDKKGGIKRSASLTANDGTKLRLSHLVKYADLYKETKLFKAVDDALKTPVTKKPSTYTFEAPKAVKSVIGGIKEVGKVFKLAGGAIIDAVTVDNSDGGADSAEASTPSPVLNDTDEKSPEERAALQEEWRVYKEQKAERDADRSARIAVDVDKRAKERAAARSKKKTTIKKSFQKR